MARVKVKLNGGPKDGVWVDYDTPLPETIVITEVSSSSMKYHDYERINTYDYEYREPK